MMVDSSIVLDLELTLSGSEVDVDDVETELAESGGGSWEAFDEPAVELGSSGKKYVISGSVVVDGELICCLIFSCSVNDGPESLRSLPALSVLALKFDTDAAADASEFGGLRVPSEATDNIDPSRAVDNLAVAREDVVVDVLYLFFDSESFALTDSGMPSHFVFTLGTLTGSFCEFVVCTPKELAFAPFSAACLRCCSANWSRADCEGSFSVKKASMPLLFFFCDVFESFDDEALELEARLGDARLRVSNDSWTGDEVVEPVVDGRKSSSASLDGVSELEVFWEESDV